MKMDYKKFEELTNDKIKSKESKSTSLYRNQMSKNNKVNVKVNISRVALRENKSTSSNMITTYTNGTKLVKDSNSSDKEWSKIIYPDNGYIMSKYITEV